MRTSLAAALSFAAVAVAGVTACHPPPPPSAPQPQPLANGVPAAAPARPAGSLPLLYADLFVDGANWSFPAVAERRHRDEFGVEYSSDHVRATITCRMTHLLVIRGGRRADLECTADRADFPMTNAPGGTFVGTADGLYQVANDFNNDIASLDPRRVLLPPHPVTGRRDFVEDGFSQAIETYKEAGGYCYIFRADGEWEGWQLCIRAGTGIIGGAGFYLGAGSELFQFGTDHQM